MLTTCAAFGPLKSRNFSTCARIFSNQSFDDLARVEHRFRHTGVTDEPGCSADEGQGVVSCLLQTRGSDELDQVAHVQAGCGGIETDIIGQRFLIRDLPAPRGPVFLVDHRVAAAARCRHAAGQTARAGDQPARKEQAEIARLRRELETTQPRLDRTETALEIMGKARALLEDISESADTETKRNKR